MARTSAAKKPRTPKAEPEAPEPQGDVKFSGKMKIDANKAVSDLAKALLDDFKQFAPIGRTWDKCPEHEQEGELSNVGRGDGEQPHDPVTGEIPANAGDPTAQPTADSAA